MTDAELARKVTKIVVREYDKDGQLLSETRETKTERFTPQPQRIVGFAQTTEIAR